VALLARRFLDELSSEGRGCRLSDAALAKLSAHDWPGNVRELRNVLRRAAVLGGPVIGPEDLALDVAPARFDHEVVRIDRPYLEIEKEILRRAIQRARGSRRAAAHALQIPKSTLCDKAKRYGLDYDEEEVA
jgi:DNA-binding NtrC family response regulator